MAIDFDSMTPQQWADWNMKTMAACLDGPKPNKYRAKRTEYNGVMYDSNAEAKHAFWLDTDPAVAWWLRQVWVPLGPDFGTRVDFLVAHGSRDAMTGVNVSVHEVKGVETPQFRKVRKLWPKYAPMPMYVFRGDQWAIIEGKP